MTTINIFTGGDKAKQPRKLLRPGRVAKQPSPVRPVAFPNMATPQRRNPVLTRPTAITPVQQPTRTAFPVASRNRITARNVARTALNPSRLIRAKGNTGKVLRTALNPIAATKFGLKMANPVNQFKAVAKFGKSIGKKFKKWKKRRR